MPEYHPLNICRFISPIASYCNRPTDRPEERPGRRKFLFSCRLLVSRGVSRSARKTPASTLIVASSPRLYRLSPTTSARGEDSRAEQGREKGTERKEKGKERNTIEDDKSPGPRRDGCNKRRLLRRVTAIEITRLIPGARLRHVHARATCYANAVSSSRKLGSR